MEWGAFEQVEGTTTVQKGIVTEIIEPMTDTVSGFLTSFVGDYWIIIMGVFAILIVGGLLLRLPRKLMR